jgi:glycosyl hydrolase family 39 (putative alpha-L-iduronidase)
MAPTRPWPSLLSFALAIAVPVLAHSEAAAPVKLEVSWGKATGISKTTPTLQVVVNPPLRRGTPVHDNAFQALKDLGADYVRYVPWLPYPKLGVAELEAPKDGKTSWDFTYIDPMTTDFLEATRGHDSVLNFSTIPQWMVKTAKPVTYPDDPDGVTWTYTQGNDFRDPSFKEVAEYYARLLSWYTKGGFTDELGKRHESGHRYKVAYWEVLNEIDLERNLSPEAYVKLYDAVVTAMRAVSPDTRFVGLALAYPGKYPEQFEYFLNPKNHQPGVPLDFISYHFYAVPTPDQGPELQPHVFFAQADGFLNTVRYVEQVRKRLSPGTRTTINEIGAISADDLMQSDPSHVPQPIPASYWNLTCAMYAYLFGEMTKIGIDVAGESQLVGYPTQFPSVSMVDWTNGKPNPRYWALKLLKDNFSPGDKLVETRVESPYLYALGVVKPDGRKRLLLVNKRERDAALVVAGAGGGRIEFVDATTKFGPPGSQNVAGDEITLRGLAVAALTLP